MDAKIHDEIAVRKYFLDCVSDFFGCTVHYERCLGSKHRFKKTAIRIYLWLNISHCKMITSAKTNFSRNLLSHQKGVKTFDCVLEETNTNVTTINEAQYSDTSAFPKF